MDEFRPEDIQEEEEAVDTCVIIDEDGNEEEYGVYGIFEAGGNAYAAVYPLEGYDAEDEEVPVFFYRYTEDENGEEAELADIESEEEYEMVEDAFEEILDEMDFEGMGGQSGEE